MITPGNKDDLLGETLVPLQALLDAGPGEQVSFGLTFKGKDKGSVFLGAGLDEGLSSFGIPTFSFLWRIPIRGTNRSDE